MRKALLIMAGMAAVSIGDAQAQFEPFMSEVHMFAFNFCPKGSARIQAQLLPINQNQALFSLLQNRYGGDGRVTFALPLGHPLYTADRLVLNQCIALEGIFPSRE